MYIYIYVYYVYIYIYIHIYNPLNQDESTPSSSCASECQAAPEHFIYINIHV